MRRILLFFLILAIPIGSYATLLPERDAGTQVATTLLWIHAIDGLEDIVGSTFPQPFSNKIIVSLVFSEDTKIDCVNYIVTNRNCFFMWKNIPLNEVADRLMSLGAYVRDNEFKDYIEIMDFVELGNLIGSFNNF